MASTTRIIRVKFDGDAKDLARATRAAEKAVADFGEKGGRKFTSSFKKWLTGAGAKDLHDSGRFGASVFGSGLLGALKTPVIGPILAAAFGAAVLTVLPAVGAIAAGALVAGFGAGLAGLGLVFAAKNEEVKKVWSDTMSDLGRDMELLAEPFQTTLIRIAGFFRRTVDAFNPHLAKAFSKMAGPIEEFADDAAQALEELIPAIDPITDAFNGVLGALGPALRSAIGEVSDGLIELAHSVNRNPQALADMVEGIGKVVTAALGLITTLNNVNTDFTELTGGLSLVDVAFATVTGGLIALTAAFSVLDGVLVGVNALLHDTDIKAGSMAAAAQRVRTAAETTSPKMKALADRTQEAKTATAAAKQRFEELITSMFRLQNLALGLSGAQINLADAVATATASVGENGRTLNINTEKGRANRTALNQIATAANAQTEAMLRSGQGNTTAAAAAVTSRQRFSELAQKMGLSKTEADALAASLIAIPNVTRRVVIKYSSTGVNLTTPSSVGRRQHGGPVSPGRAFLVGERGPELIVPRAAGNVVPNHQLTRLNGLANALSGGAGAGQPIIVENHIEIGGEVVRVVRTEITAKDRRTKRALTSGAVRTAGMAPA